MQPASASETPPEGHEIIMPALGMAQDTGLLVSWQKAPGDAVAADDVLFEVETDKSTVEVAAGFDGFVAALLAEAGDNVPVGEVVAVISAEKPTAATRSARSKPPSAAKAPAAPAPEPVASKPSPAPAITQKAKPATMSGRILASPKLRRLAAAQGLDLDILRRAGVPEPYHAKDLTQLIQLSSRATTSAATIAAARRITAQVPSEGFSAFAAWAHESAGISDSVALLAGLLAGSLRQDDSDIIVAVENYGATTHYHNPDRPRLGQAKALAADGTPSIILRDMRISHISSVTMGAEEAPVITILPADTGLGLILECSAAQLSASGALDCLQKFAARLAEPLNHIL